MIIQTYLLTQILQLMTCYSSAWKYIHVFSWTTISCSMLVYHPLVCSRMQLQRCGLYALNEPETQLATDLS